MLSTFMIAVATPAAYTAFAAGLLWLVSHHVSRVSWKAAVLLALLPLTFTAPALLGNRAYAPLDLPYYSEPYSELREEMELPIHPISKIRYDLAAQMVPWRKATREAISQGHWPLLNPYMLSGDILAGAAQPAPYHPIHLISYALPFGQDLTFAATAVLLLAGISSFCLTRELGCSEMASLIGAAAWRMCDFMLFWMGWPMVMTVAPLPLLLLAARRAARSPGLRSTGLLTTALVLVVLGGHPESTLHLVAVGAGYGIVELLVSRARRLLSVLATCAGAGAIALALTAVYLLPFVEALHQTRQYAQRHRAQHHASQSVDWNEAAARSRALVLPYAYGVPGDGWQRVSRFGQLRSGYAGSILLAPALLGLLRSRWRGRWLMAGLVLAGASLYVGAPGLTDLLDRLPLFAISINRRLAFLSGLGVAVLAALGLETWSRDPSRNRLEWWSAGCLATLVAATAALWPSLVDNGLSTRMLRDRALMELMPIVLATAAIASTGMSMRRSAHPSRSAAVGMVLFLALLLGQRVVQMGDLNHSFPPALASPRIHGLDALPEDGEPYRVTGLGGSMMPNTSALLELEDVRGYEAMTHLGLFSTLELWSGTTRYHTHAARVTDLSLPFLSFLNVRFAITPSTTRPPEGWTRVSGGRGWSLLENHRALPRAFVPTSVIMTTATTSALRTQMKAQTDLSKVAWIHAVEPGPVTAGDAERQGEAAPRQGSPPRRREPNGPGWVISRWRGLDLELMAELERPGWVVISQTAWKGWRARSDQGPVPLHRANKAFLALHLPAGTSHVDLEYRPRSFEIGRAVSLATAALLFVLLSLVAVVRRSRVRPPLSAGR